MENVAFFVSLVVVVFTGLAALFALRAARKQDPHINTIALNLAGIAAIALCADYIIRLVG
jgi:hypothetical protein